MRMLIRSLTLLVLAAALIAPAGAEAGEYVVYTCKLPDGRPAPADGWTTTGTAAYAWFENGCAAGGPLAAGLRGGSQPVNRSNVGWGFDSGAAPVRGYMVHRSGRVSGGGANASMYMFTADGANSAETGRVIDYCAFFAGCRSLAGVVNRSAPLVPDDSHGWFFTLGCGGYAGDACTPIGAPDLGQLSIDSATFRLGDDAQPAVDAAVGTLLADAATSGSLELTATDDVSGVARAAIEVDGAQVATQRAGGDRCAPVGVAAGGNDYLYRRPCPARWQFDLNLPAGVLSTGSHTIRARVFDAAGNSATAFGPRVITLSNVHGSGASAARIVLDGSTRMKAAYGRLARLSGRLETNAGEPLGGANLLATLSSSAAVRGEIVEQLLTAADGRFSLTIRATSNRSIRLENAASGAVAELNLEVRAPVRLKARRRRIAPLGRMTLTGTIPGERARRGASVAIKVRSGRRWRTVGIARSSTRGRFRFSYRFRRTRNARLTFRAVALRSSDLTIAPRPSMPVRIRVG